MGDLLQEVEVETVGELKQFLDDISDDMPVTDAVGNLLCVRVYDIDGVATMEMQ